MYVDRFQKRERKTVIWMRDMDTWVKISTWKQWPRFQKSR